jgi:hypothetical protein
MVFLYPVPVYVIHYRAPEWCATATKSIIASKDVDVRVVVIDNSHSSPRLAQLLPPGVRIVGCSGNTGYSGGANKGIEDWREQWPESPYALVCSHDVILEADCVSRLVGAAEADPSYGLLGPLLLDLHPDHSGGGTWNGRRAFQVGYSAVPGDVVSRDWVNGTCMLLRARCISDVGGFDQQLHSYVEDVDIGLRANDLGWKVGVVFRAVARGQGSAVSHVQARIVKNTVLLAAKRLGVKGASCSALDYARRVPIGLASSLNPKHPTAVRAALRHEHLEAVRGLLQVSPSTLYRAVKNRN